MAVIVTWVGLIVGGNLAHADASAENAGKIGIDAVAEVGPILSYGATLRIERPSGRSRAWVYRAGVMQGTGVLMGGEAFQAVVGQVGHRFYSGLRSGLYLGLEGGLAALRFPRHRGDFDEMVGTEWILTPSASLSLGSKLGRVDIGISAMFPFLGVGLHFGFDFESW